MDEQKYIYLVTLDPNHKPSLYKSKVIKETPKFYLCESRGPATHYSSRVDKRNNPCMTAVAAWVRYIVRAKELLLSYTRRLDETTAEIKMAEAELEKLTCV